ncbi:MAG: hypothetical protein ACFFAO_13085 [Candidatus Hermodarchaeota archaeon]
MSGEKYDNFSHYFDGLKRQGNEITRKRKELNKNIKKFLNKFQKIEFEIYKSFFVEREFYIKERNFCQKKIRRLRKIKKNNEILIENLINKKESFPKPKLDNNLLELKIIFNKIIKKITNKINDLNQVLVTQILDINKESFITEKIIRLEKKKEERVKILSKIEQKQIKDLNSCEHIIIQKKIDILETKLQVVNRKLNKWVNNRRSYHRKMLVLYRKTNEFKYYVKKIEKEIIENKCTADDFYLQLPELLNQNDKILSKIREYKRDLKEKQEHKPTLHEKEIIEKKKSYKKYKKEKLAIALEKKRTGKRLHVSELKLILDASEK